MFRNRLYYRLKPLLPWSFRMGLRRWFALRKRPRVTDRWPILPGSEQPPPGWPGWPDGKQFALVLTHDVEGPEGLAKVRPLAELEMSLGFRSSFNFIPEGNYRVPDDLRHWLTANGFEVGVHDLKHDGNLFRSRPEFARNASQINQHLKDWGAAGFRAGFMLHERDWLHDLQIRYDTSTFDTDPFEPQPYGIGTIFPFWVPKPHLARNPNPNLTPTPSLSFDPIPPSSVPLPPPSPPRPGRGTEGEVSNSSLASGSARSPLPRSPSDLGLRTSDFNSTGYVELPYTLPQDSTLFLLLRETTPAIWLRKLDWVAAHGGMALVNVHPDYVQFESEPASPRTAPVQHYATLLRHVRERYAATGWHALPRQIAHLVRPPSDMLPPSVRPSTRSANHKPRIWIDLDNTPHVPFFEPILEELRARGYPVLVTARDAFQVCALAERKGLACVRVGRHHGKNRFAKAAGLAYRALQLAPHVLRGRPTLGVSHGSRSQLLLGNWLRLPTVLIEDYEHSRFPIGMHPTWIMAPDVIPDVSLVGNHDRIRKYPGIKEDVYAWKLQPDLSLLRELGLAPTDLIVTVRPPATEAHYHNPESERLFTRFMDRAAATPGLRVVLLPRNARQAAAIRQQAPQWFADRKTVIPADALDGLNLIWYSDLVVSGGGTMNREAAALNVPVYSIFRGTIGAVDRHLCAEGRLILIASLADVDEKIQLVRRPRKPLADITSRRTLTHIVNTLEEIATACAR